MKKKVLILLLIAIIILILIFFSIPRCDKETYEREYTLIWSDEFNDNNLDTSKWSIFEGTTKNIVNSQEYYLKDEVYLQNGSLIIRSQERSFNNNPYTSGMINLKKELSKKYGKFEIRAKLPTGKGIHSAFWLIGRDKWPPEIDIFEMLGKDPETIYMTNHWLTLDLPFKFPGTTSLFRTYKQEKFISKDFSKDFHIYSVEWTPNEIIWYIDNTERHRSNKGVPCVPMYVILNTAVGNDWALNPDESTIFPQYFEIDYVRVYQKR